LTLFRPFLRWQQQRNNQNAHQQADHRRVNPNREVSRTRESSAMPVSVVSEVSERRHETRRVPIPSASNRASEALGIAARAPNHARAGGRISDAPHAGGIVHRNTSRHISSRAPGGVRDDAVSSVTARLPVPFLRAPPSTPPFVSGNQAFPMSPHRHPGINRPVAGSLVPRSPEQMLEESLTAHAGLVIQRITNALTPRRHSSSHLNTPAPARRYRSASIPSAEKFGPTHTLNLDDQVTKKLECKICFDAQVNTVLLPCGHACCCEDCSVKVKFATLDSKCPICRGRIQNISMLFFS